MLSSSIKYEVDVPKIATGRMVWKTQSSPNVLEDHIYAVRFYLLDGLPKSPCEVLNKFRFLLENSL